MKIITCFNAFSILDKLLDVFNCFVRRFSIEIVKDSSVESWKALACSLQVWLFCSSWAADAGSMCGDLEKLKKKCKWKYFTLDTDSKL